MAPLWKAVHPLYLNPKRCISLALRRIFNVILFLPAAKRFRPVQWIRPVVHRSIYCRRTAARRCPEGPGLLSYIRFDISRKPRTLSDQLIAHCTNHTAVSVSDQRDWSRRFALPGPTTATLQSISDHLVVIPIVFLYSSMVVLAKACLRHHNFSLFCAVRRERKGYILSVKSSNCAEVVNICGGNGCGGALAPSGPVATGPAGWATGCCPGTAGGCEPCGPAGPGPAIIPTPLFTPALPPSICKWA